MKAPAVLRVRQGSVKRAEASLARRLSGPAAVRLPLVLAFLLVACGRPTLDLPDGAASWLWQLPAEIATVAPGDRVWATVPASDHRDLKSGIFTVRAVEGRWVELVEDLSEASPRLPEAKAGAGQPATGLETVLRTPAALVHSLPRRDLNKGDPALAGDGSAAVGVVQSPLESDPAGIDTPEGSAFDLAMDWNGKTVNKTLSEVVGLAGGDAAAGGDLILRRLRMMQSKPGEGSDSNDRQLAPSTYPWRVGLGIAQDGERVWVLDESGRVSVVAVGAVAEFLGPRTLPEAGDRVRVLSWAKGDRSGVVETVLEPGLRFRIVLDGGGEADQTDSVFITQLTADG